jgi:ABC-type transporter MlaC component
MVYVRWIRKKNGTLVGPYLYKSVRVGKTVTGKYIRKATPNDIKKFKNRTRK